MYMNLDMMYEALRAMYRKCHFYRYSNYGIRLASRVPTQKEHGSGRKEQAVFFFARAMYREEVHGSGD
jgi:hypothetical protein